MNPPTNFVQVIGRKRYSVQNSTLIASDCYWDGRNFERNGRNEFLYRTKNGRYFVLYLSMWQGEHNYIRPVTKEEAIELYEDSHREREESFEDAFPGVVVEEA